MSIEKFKPYALSVVEFQRKQIPQFFGFLKRGATFKIEHNLIELIVRKFRPAMQRKLFGVVFLQLSLEIGYKISLLMDFNVFIRHIREGLYQTFFQCIFALSKCHLYKQKLRLQFSEG